MVPLVVYNSQEGEHVEKYLKNGDLAKLVESYLFNDAYMRVKLPENLSEKTKLYTNMNTVLDHEQFTGFYAFHYEKDEAHSVITNQEIQTRVNEFVQNFLANVSSSQFQVLDHYLDFRFNGCIWSVLYLQTSDSNETPKMAIKEIDVAKHDPKIRELFRDQARLNNQPRPQPPRQTLLERINKIMSSEFTSGFLSGIAAVCITASAFLTLAKNRRM